MLNLPYVFDRGKNATPSFVKLEIANMLSSPPSLPLLPLLQAEGASGLSRDRVGAVSVSSMTSSTSRHPFLTLKAECHGSAVFWLKVMNQIFMGGENENITHPAASKLEISSMYLKTYSEVVTLLGVHIFLCQPIGVITARI